jgi:hypothetical protein
LWRTHNTTSHIRVRSFRPHQRPPRPGRSRAEHASASRPLQQPIRPSRARAPAELRYAGLPQQPLVAAVGVLGEGFDAVLPSVTGTLATPRWALHRAGTPTQARSVSFAEGVRDDARECLTRARRERRVERVARRATRAARVVVEEFACSRAPPHHRGREPPPSPSEESRGRAA